MKLIALSRGDPQHALPEVPWHDISAQALNGDETVRLIRGPKPDILLVCSAPMLKSVNFTTPRIASLNVHCGMSSHYRSEHSLFWPLFFKEDEQLGVTGHRIDAGIKTGLIVGQAKLQRDATSTDTTLLAKATRLSAELDIDNLLRLEAGPAAGLRQSQAGRQFSFRARRPWHDAKLKLRHVASAGKLPPANEQCWFNRFALEGNALAPPTPAKRFDATASGA